MIMLNITVHLAKNDEGPSNGTSGSSRRGLTCPKVEKKKIMEIMIIKTSRCDTS